MKKQVKVTTTKVSARTFRVGEVIGIDGWHPYCVAVIERLTKSVAVIEHEGMTFTMPVARLRKMAKVA
jgi:hypothetical protein